MRSAEKLCDGKVSSTHVSFYHHASTHTHTHKMGNLCERHARTRLEHIIVLLYINRKKKFVTFCTARQSEKTIIDRANDKNCIAPKRNSKNVHTIVSTGETREQTLNLKKHATTLSKYHTYNACIPVIHILRTLFDFSVLALVIDIHVGLITGHILFPGNAFSPNLSYLSACDVVRLCPLFTVCTFSPLPQQPFRTTISCPQPTLTLN